MGYKLYLVLHVLILALSQVSSRHGIGYGMKKSYRFLDQNEDEKVDYNAPGRSPFLVRLSRDRMGHTFFCSGVIYDQRHIITAGICAKLMEDRAFAVVGDYSTEEENGERVYEINNFMVHENMSNYLNNIAILRTKHPIQYSWLETYGATQRIGWLDNNNPSQETGKYYTVAWTHDNNNHGTPRFFPTKITSISKCSEKYPKLQAEDTICAQVEGPNGGPCSNRDIGAPLVVVLRNHKVRLVGINSELPTYPTCEPEKDRYTTFLKISQYKDWFMKAQIPSFMKDIIKRMESFQRNQSHHMQNDYTIKV